MALRERLHLAGQVGTTIRVLRGDGREVSCTEMLHSRLKVGGTARNVVR